MHPSEFAWKNPQMETKKAEIPCMSVCFTGRVPLLRLSFGMETRVEAAAEALGSALGKMGRQQGKAKGRDRGTHA
jgi:hypothetical protein